MKRIVAASVGATAVAAVLAGALVAPQAAADPAAPAAQPEFVPEPIAWGPCENPKLVEAGAECGMLAVPLDYRHPGGETVRIAVSRIKHTSPEDKYQGPMLVNPGGPGGSGLTLSLLGGSVPHGAGETFDWIGFDPRGVGSSVPAVSCDPQYMGYDRPEYEPSTPELEQAWLDRSAGYSQACADKNGPILDHVKTTDTVADMDSIRKALNAEKLNYYGFSYGTYLGQVYGTLHPEHLGRVVLDGVVNVKDVWYDANLNQDRAFDRNIKTYFDWIARHDEVYHLGTSGPEVEKLYYQVHGNLDRVAAGGVIGSAELTDLFLPAGYGQSGWDEIAKAFAAYVHTGDWAPLKTLYDDAAGLGDDNGFAMYLATQCSDVQWPKKWSTWKRDNTAVAATAPFQTWGNAWFNAPCLTWPAKAGKPVEVDGSQAPPALLISEEHDGATPFPGALEARSRFPESSLIALPGGTTHSGSLNGNACLDDQIADYLATGKLPERRPGNGPDATCDPLPQPVPEAGAATARQSNRPEAVDRALRAAAIR